jgi:endonuclease/exonuclease/phosphatase family metal-dependent hydrolase
MKIYSWNVYYHSKTPEKQFEYIQNLDFDILCLQEVPKHLLERFEMLPYHAVSAIDIAYLSPKKERNVYAAILSRYPIPASGEITFPRIALPSRSRLLLKLRTGWSDFHRQGSVYADINTGHGLVRVFSLHLSLSSPSDRKLQFDAVEKFFPKKAPVIIAGDFNIIERSSVKMLCWFTGSSVAEAMPWHRERSAVEARFKEWGLKNPLRKKVTHGFSHSQLDHVLVPHEAKVLKAEVVKKTYTSDHHPVMVEVTLPSR